MEVNEVSHTVKTPVPCPHHPLWIDQQEVFPSTSLRQSQLQINHQKKQVNKHKNKQTNLHPSQHVLTRTALALSHQEVAVLQKQLFGIFVIVIINVIITTIIIICHHHHLHKQLLSIPP